MSKVEKQILIYETEYRIFYSNEQCIPIEYIIESLKALKQNFHLSSKFIEKVYPEFQVIDSEIFIENLQSGSLDVQFLIKKTLQKAKNTAQKAQKVTKTVTPSKETIQDIVKQTTIALVIEGAKLLMTTNPSPTPAINIQNNYTIVNNGEVILTEKDFKEVIDKLPKKQLAQNAVDIIKPAKLDSNAEIQFAPDNTDRNTYTMDQTTLSSLPEHYTPPLQKEREIFHKDVQLSIYASDKDRRQQGWAGSIHSLSHDRVTLKLNESVNPELLHGKTQVKASVNIHEKYNPQKKKFEISYIDVLDFK